MTKRIERPKDGLGEHLELEHWDWEPVDFDTDSVDNFNKFCPACGGELRPFGNSISRGQFKTCKLGHGISYTLGGKAGSKLGVMFEPFTE